MNIKHSIDPSNYEVAAIIGRFQTNVLHEGHINFIKSVLTRHKKTIILLGVARIQNTTNNPLDFATREAMIKDAFPSVIVLPIIDQRYDEKWSQDVDNQISIPYGEKKIIIYGRPDDAYRMGYLDIMWKEVTSENNQYDSEIYNTLESTVAASIELSYKRFNDKIPAYIQDAMHIKSVEASNGGLGFMGSPAYFEATKKIDDYFANKKRYA